MKVTHSADKFIAHSSLKFPWAQIAEGEDNNQELFQSQVSQEKNRDLRENIYYKPKYK